LNGVPPHIGTTAVESVEGTHDRVASGEVQPLAAQPADGAGKGLRDVRRAVAPGAVADRVADDDHAARRHTRARVAQDARLVFVAEVVEDIEQRDAPLKVDRIAHVAAAEVDGAFRGLARRIDLLRVVIDTGHRRAESAAAERQRQQTEAAAEVEERKLGQSRRDRGVDRIAGELRAGIAAQKSGVEEGRDVLRHGDTCSIRSMSSGRLNGFGRMAFTPIWRMACGS